MGGPAQEGEDPLGHSIDDRIEIDGAADLLLPRVELLEQVSVDRLLHRGELRDVADGDDPFVVVLLVDLDLDPHGGVPGLAEGDHVAGGQTDLATRLGRQVEGLTGADDPGAVGAVVVAQDPAVSGEDHGRVLAGHVSIAELEVAGVDAADLDEVRFALVGDSRGLSRRYLQPDHGVSIPRGAVSAHPSMRGERSLPHCARARRRASIGRASRLNWVQMARPSSVSRSCSIFSTAASLPSTAISSSA